jgi:hypothetical protein
MAAGTTDSQFRTQFRSPKSVTGATLLLFGAGAAAFVAGCLIIMLRARRR